MNFKRLEIYGFKSFADKIKIEFGEGVTGIVGPNGCGKSNVADSVRWVLGEQSAKLLRGRNMQDVIFSGTERRRSLSFCEVLLHFDNYNRAFPIEYDEIVISRKLYRSGESEYSLNHSTCRLKDIVDLLRDTGIGKEGYCIIGQGRIDEILSAKPDDRRGIFEEAAGISKFKSRKNDAERKLERTHDNILRLSDIILELNRQIGPLESQANDARKYLELRDKLKYNEINSYLFQYDNASKNKHSIGDRLKAINEEIEIREKDFNLALNRYNKHIEAIASADNNIAMLRDEQTELMVNNEKLAGQNRLLSERLNNLKRDNERISNDLSNDSAMLDTNSDNLKNVAIMRNELTNIIKEKNIEVDLSTRKYQELYDEITEYENQIESSKNKIYDSMNELGGIKNNLGKLMAEQDSFLLRYEENDKKVKQLKQTLKEIKENVDSLAVTISGLNNEKKEIQLKKNNLTVRSNELQQTYSDCTDEVRSLNGRVSALDTKCKMLDEMRKEYEGYQYSVKKLMQDVSFNSEIKNRIEGVVAQLIKVPDELQTAIEMALGNALQNIVTRDEEDAKYIIEYLKQKRYGRVTFLPISAVNGRLLEGNQKNVVREKGCFGIASDLISYDKKYAGIMQGLLGKTVIVDNLETAVYIAKNYNYAFKIVTLEGDLITSFGAITGGSRKSETSNLLSQEQQLISTKEALNVTRVEFEKKTIALENCKEEMASNSSELAKIIDTLHKIDINLATEMEKESKTSTAIEIIEKDIQKIEEDSRATLVRIDSIENQIKTADKLEVDINTQQASTNTIIVQHKHEFEAKRMERERLATSLSELRVECRSIEAQIKSADDDIARNKKACQELEEKINDYRVKFKMNLAKTQETENEIYNTQFKDIDKLRVEEIKNKIILLDQNKKTLQDDQVELDIKKNILIKQIQEIHEKKTREDMLLARIDTDIDVMQTRIWEEYELTYTTALVFRDQEYDDNKSISIINKIKKEMLDLGYVNVRAIEDCKVVGERYTELVNQKDDLEKAEKDLISIIKQLANQMTDKFKTEFEKINRNFAVIFKELFGGGTGKLVLDESAENTLEAGIEILAEPPGKNLQSITLLSGGERALTAIAIMFAIIKLKPIPFCILDEIEAALDDSNAKLFATYLRKFSNDTQFIVITHRKPTMELADSLYGVTMEEKGVSKIISVKLSDAVKVAEPANVV